MGASGFVEDLLDVILVVVVEHFTGFLVSRSGIGSDRSEQDQILRLHGSQSGIIDVIIIGVVVVDIAGSSSAAFAQMLAEFFGRDIEGRVFLKTSIQIANQ